LSLGDRGRYGPFIAAALIMAAIAAGLMLMPRVMTAVSASGGGPIAGALVATAFLSLLFIVLWLRGRYQARNRVD